MGSTVFPAPASGITVAEGTAAGWGNAGETWTLLDRQTIDAYGFTYNGLSGYKKYKLRVFGMAAYSNPYLYPYIHLNGNTEYKYSNYITGNGTNSSTPFGITSVGTSGLPLSYGALTIYQSVYADIIIDNANSTTAAKTVSGKLITYTSSYGITTFNNHGSWNSTSAVTTIKLGLTNNSSADSGYCFFNGSSSYIEFYGGN